MKTINNLSIAVMGTAIFLLQSGNTQAATITFFDSTFNNEYWEVTPFIQGSGGAIDANQITSSDNQFRQIINTVYADQNVSFIIGFHQRIGAVYNPQLQGAISSIDYSENSILFSGFGDGQATGLALKQNEKVYLAWVGTTPEYSWTTKSAHNLQQSNFSLIGNGTEHPDFSSTATPIEFGFFRSNSTCETCSGYTNVGGIDNWSVTINQDESQPVPEPTTVLGTLAFGAVISRWRMKRKQQQKVVNSTVS